MTMTTFVRSYWHHFIGLALVISIFYYLQLVDIAAVAKQLLSKPALIAKIVFISGLASVFATLAWQSSFKKLFLKSLPNFGTLYAIRMIGETISLLTPMNIVGGEASKAYLLRSYDIPTKACVSSIVISRGLIIISYLSLNSVIGLYLLCKSDSSLSLLSLSILLLIILLGIISMVLLGGMRRTTLIQKIHDFISHIKGHYKHNSKEVQLAYLFSIIHWMIGIIEFYVILNSLGMPITYADAAILEMGVMAFKSVGAFVPGQLGIEEYGNKAMLSTIGIPGIEIWITVSIIRRIRQLIWVFISTIISILFFKKTSWKFSL